MEKKRWHLLESGRFWLNEQPLEIPTSTDRSVTDKGFKNMNTYRAVLWLRIQRGQQSLCVFNSHYPLDGDSWTRLQCTRVEHEMIQKIAKDGEPWISTGDRNLVLRPKDDVKCNPQTIKEVWVEKKCCVVPDHSRCHLGLQHTTWLGFSYDACQYDLQKGFHFPCVMDLMVGGPNLTCSQSWFDGGFIDDKSGLLIDISAYEKDRRNWGEWQKLEYSLLIMLWLVLILCFSPLI